MEKVILASQSPRRQALLHQLGWEVIIVKPEVDEQISDEWTVLEEVPVHLSKIKAHHVRSQIQETILPIIAADTVVIHKGQILGKPQDATEAFHMIKSLSGQTHQVVTGVCILKGSQETSFYSLTHVSFAEIDDKDIEQYINSGDAYDKAGSYGIQDWIGLIGVSHIEGDYYNVMGLPVQKIYQKIKAL